MAAMPHHYLAHGRHVHVRDATPDDAQQLVDWRFATAARPWLVDWEQPSVERQRQWQASRAALGDMLMMFEDSQGQLFGGGSIYDFDRCRTSAEYGRLIRGAALAEPLAFREAVYWMCRTAFELLGLVRMHHATGAENRPALQIISEFGGQQEGYRRSHFLTPAGYRDIVEFGMLAEDFAGARPALEARIFGPGPPPPLSETTRGWAADFLAKFPCLGVPRIE